MGRDEIMSIVIIIIVVVVVVVIIIIIISSSSSSSCCGGGSDCLEWEVAGDHRVQQHAERPDVRLHGGDMQWW